MNWEQKTIDTYDRSARKLAEYFRGIGSRIDDIETGLRLAKSKESAKVIEIGCGDGRDAQEIVKRVKWYEGFDPSIGLLNLAKEKVPGSSFVLANALTYTYPEDLDIIFAFASLLHVNKRDLKRVFNKAAKSLKLGGIFYISLKEKPNYCKEVKNDEHGQRMFYYYNPAIIKELSSHLFKPVHEDHQKIGSTDWFTIALSKL